MILIVIRLLARIVFPWLSSNLVKSALKTEIMEVFQNVHSQVVFEKSLNASFLALIPQKVNAVEVKDFQPISIVGGDLEDYFYGVG